MAKTWRYWINPIFIFCWGYLVIFGSLYQTLFQSSFLKFLFLFTLLIPIPVFFKPFQWTDFLHIYLGGQWETKYHDILPGKYYHMPCLPPCSWRPSSPVSFSWWTFLQTFSTSSQTTQPVETFLPSISILVVSSMSIYVIKKESEKLKISYS